MANVIIGIHGLGNKPPKKLLEHWWQISMMEGLKMNNFHTALPKFELVYWADLLYDQPLNPHEKNPESPYYLDEKYAPSPRNFTIENHDSRIKIVDYLNQQLNRIFLNDDFTLNYSYLTDAIIRKYFRELELYYAENCSLENEEDCKTKDIIRERLLRKLEQYKDDDIMLISHSMGSIAAFDVLTFLAEHIPIHTFITIGSPLGLPIVVSKIAAEQRQKLNGKSFMVTPPGVMKHWYNLSDIMDKITFNFKLSDDFSANERGVMPTDFLVTNNYQMNDLSNPHKSYGYLRTPEFSTILNRFIHSERLTFTQKISRKTKQILTKVKTIILQENKPQISSPMKTSSTFNRNHMLSEAINPKTLWDIAIIGGGATGVGAALEATSRGYKVILIEQSDFGKATSSRSTKLAHGGVRYLQQGNISLVLEALSERGIMRRNAPHLVHNLPFIVPNYDWWEGPFYGIGLKIYDMLAGKEGFGPSKMLSREETMEYIPTVETEGLRGGVIYHDGQFDDARLLINLMQTAVEQGAVMLNYVKATALIKENNVITGLEAKDVLSNETFDIKAKVVINATGVFTDAIREMDDLENGKIMTSSQGVHLVLDKSFLPGDTAIMVPHTDDGRVLFAVPWYNRTLIGTTDTFVEDYALDPIPQEEEINFLLEHAARYLTKDPQRSDVKSVFVGLRPLVKNNSDSDTSAISRDHVITISRTGLISISGGKWTTYRKMGEDVIEKAIILGNLPESDSVTQHLSIHGAMPKASHMQEFNVYGSDAEKLKKLIKEDKDYGLPIHIEHAILQGEVVWAVRNEMAQTIEDFLARRTRLLLLDAKASVECAPLVAKIMAKELDKNRAWEKSQVQEFEALAKSYILA